jgi:ribonuclease HI
MRPLAGGILNEVFKYSPDPLLRCVHAVFQRLSAGEGVPAALSRSVTVLLYKKDDPTDIANYRPIGLANTLMKFWTKLVAWVTTDYTEHFRILDRGQAGFRPGYHTHLHTQSLVSALEYAKETRKDVYMLQIDFTNAFNRVNHDKLFRIMTALGYPPSLVHIVRQAYATSSTQYRTPHGDTPPMQVGRGTIQGDSLSPILFAIYIEPLLRWLRSGSRVCHLSPSDDSHAIDNLTYADDLCVLSPTLADARIQAAKISKYSEWADLTPNLKKSFASAVLYHSARHRSPTSPAGLALTRARTDRQIPFFHSYLRYLPPTAPFDYLGITMTMTLNWSFHQRRALADCRAQSTALASSSLTPASKLLTMQRWIQRKVAYAFPVVPYSNAEIDLLDRACAKVIRAAYGLHRGMPLALIRSSVAEFGLGHTSLSVLYHVENTKHLAWTLNHPGPVAEQTLETLRWQLKLLGHTTNPMWQDLARLSRARQAYLAMATDNLSISMDGEKLGQFLPTESVLRAALSGDDGNPCPTLPAHSIRPILDLYPGGDGLFVRGALIHESDMIRHHNTNITSAHIRAHRMLSHLLCQGGSPPAPKKPWNLSSPLTRAQLPLRPPVVAALGRHSRGAGRNPNSHSIQAAMTHPQARREDLRTTPLIPVVEAPNTSYAAPNVPHPYIRNMLKQHRPTSREHAFRVLSETPPPDTHPDDWRMALLDFMTGYQEHIRSLSDPVTIRTGPTAVRHFKVVWADTIIDEWAYHENLHHGYTAEWTRPANILPTHKCYWCGARTDTMPATCPHGCPGAPANPPTRAMWVRWLPRLEPETNLREEGYGPMIDHWLRKDLLYRRQRLLQPKPAPAPYSYQPPTHPPESRACSELLCRHVHIDTTPCDPYLDVQPPNVARPSAFLTRQHVTSIKREENHVPTVANAHLYVVHDKDGRAAGTLTRRTLASLFSGWKSTHPPSPTQTATFNNELLALVRRRRAALRPPDDVDPSPNWSLTAPPDLMRRILQAFRIRHERFATPIDRHPEIPHYWTPDAKDAVFGANYDAFSSPFTDGTFCHPNHRTKDVFRTLEWAITSAKSSTSPCLTVLLVPDAPSAGFWNLAARHTDVCRIMGTCRAIRSQFLPPDAFTLNPTLRQEQPQSATVLVVANPTGWDRLARHMSVSALQAWLKPPPASSPPVARYHTNWRPSSPSTQPPPPPTWLPPVATAHHAGTNKHTVPPTLDRPLRHQRKDVAFTDGSVRSVAGITLAGISCWQHTHDAEIDTESGGTSLLLAPGPDAPNSNHAELSAILWTLQNTNATVIATDSLASLHQISGYLSQPRRYHRHFLRGHLEAIRNALQTRARNNISPTHLVKVTAHNGTLGNELADWHASRATRDPTSVSVWTPPPTIQRAELWHTLPSGDVSRLRDTGGALTRLVRETHALGSAKTDGIYYTAYRQIATDSHTSSHHFLTPRSTSWGARRLALRYRGGGIYNNKLAHRYGLSATDVCPLCPKQDGQTHMLLECSHPDMHNMHCKRHNEAARAVLAEVIRHDLGATVIQAHIGTSTDLHPTLQNVPNQIPGVPSDHPRPDFALKVPATADSPARVLVVEVKYGADTLLENKYQHVEDLLRPTLQATSRYYRCDARLIFLALGVGGRIPTRAYQHMLELGIPRRAAHNLCNHLNIMSTQWLHKIVAGRRALAPVDIQRRSTTRTEPR